MRTTTKPAAGQGSPYEHARASWLFNWPREPGYSGAILAAWSFDPLWVCLHQHEDRDAALTCARAAFAQRKEHTP